MRKRGRGERRKSMVGDKRERGEPEWLCIGALNGGNQC